MKEGTALHFTASFVAGLTATTLAAPADLVKSRIMADKKGGGAAMYKGPIDCLLKTVRNEGPLALFRGWTASYVRLGCVACRPHASPLPASPLPASPLPALHVCFLHRPHFLVSLPLLEAIRAALGLQHM